MVSDLCTFLLLGVLTVAACLVFRRVPWEVMEDLAVIWTFFLWAAFCIAMALYMSGDLQALASCPFWP